MEGSRGCLVSVIVRLDRGCNRQCLRIHKGLASPEGLELSFHICGSSRTSFSGGMGLWRWSFLLWCICCLHLVLTCKLFQGIEGVSSVLPTYYLKLLLYYLTPPTVRDTQDDWANSLLTTGITSYVDNWAHNWKVKVFSSRWHVQQKYSFLH